MKLTQYTGESLTHRVKLTRGGQPFNPSGNVLIFTAKYSRDDEDAAAVFQKTSDAGLTTETVSGAYYALVEAVPADTSDKLPGTLVWDVKAQHQTTGAVLIVAEGTLVLTQAVTQEEGVSTPIFTTQPLSQSHVLAQMAELLAQATAPLPLVYLSQDAESATLIFGGSLNPTSGSSPYPNLTITLP